MPEITVLGRTLGHVLAQLVIVVGAGSPWEVPTRSGTPNLQDTRCGSVGGMVGRETVCDGLGSLGYVS